MDYHLAEDLVRGSLAHQRQTLPVELSVLAAQTRLGAPTH